MLETHRERLKTVANNLYHYQGTAHIKRPPGPHRQGLSKAGSNRMIHISRSVVGAAELEAMGRVMREDGYLGMGREVRAFEEELQEYLGGQDRSVICLNSGTAALHLAVQAVTDPGDEVLVQSLTFVASFQAISAAGAVPVACEVYPETVTLDLEDAARRITPRTRAVMPVHYASNPGDLEAVYGFARRHGLRVIEDAAHAFGCTYQGRKIGSFGDLVCFSFDGLKNITSGEGGVVVYFGPPGYSSRSGCPAFGGATGHRKTLSGSAELGFRRPTSRLSVPSEQPLCGRGQGATAAL